MKLSLWNFLRSCYYLSLKGKGKGIYVLGLMKHRPMRARGVVAQIVGLGSRRSELSASRPGHITHKRRAPEFV